MPCYHPRSVYRSDEVHPTTGKPKIKFYKMFEPERPDSFFLPCGQCIGCRLEHSRQVAIRAVHEASLHQQNCFITLTYKDSCLPFNNSLDYTAGPLFMKRLRKHFGSGIRAYGCAEYGEEFARPHYHLLLFNFDFPDKTPWKKSNDFPLYRSAVLERLWPFGHSSVGALTFETAAYVARYVTKKITGKPSHEHYSGRAKEKAICVPKRPGLGADWLRKFNSDVYPSDFIVLRGKKMRPPRYYDRIFDIDYPSDFASVKKLRQEKMKDHVVDNRRLKCGEIIHEQKAKQLIRGFEKNETEGFHDL